jgi:hypothetical protein
MLVFINTSLPSSTTSLNISLQLPTSFYIFLHYGLYAHTSTVLEFSKSLPDVVMAKEIDFKTWGHKFMVAIVSYHFAPILKDPFIE